MKNDDKGRFYLRYPKGNGLDGLLYTDSKATREYAIADGWVEINQSEYAKLRKKIKLNTTSQHRKPKAAKK